MRSSLTPDEARKRFADETDAAADLGEAPDAALRMTAIHARHAAALAELRAKEGEDTKSDKVRTGKVSRVV